MNTTEERNQIYDIFSNYPKLNPPYEAKGELIDDFKERIACYLNAIDEILSLNPSNTVAKEVKKRIKTITSFSEKVCDTLTSHLCGNIRESYSIFDNAITNTKMNSHIYNMTVPLAKMCNEKNPLFRVRKSNEILKDRHELFHIPFKDRHKVGAMRFSVSGLPCLYLGSSIFVCWQEMNKPDFDKLYISSFKTDNQSPELRILELGYNLLSLVHTTPLERFFKWDDDNDYYNNETGTMDDELGHIPSQNGLDKIVSKLIAWPLVLACNYTKSNIDANFHREYIIPNLLMQWISGDNNKDISGISYRSTKILNQKNSNIGLNVIIPPKMSNAPLTNKGHCPILKQTFSITNPVSWTVFSTLEINPEKYIGANADMQNISSKIENFDESLVQLYHATTFKKVELLIDQMMQYEKLL